MLYSSGGVAEVKGGVTSIRIEMNLAWANPGLYALEIRKPGSEWSSYPLRIQ